MKVIVFHSYKGGTGKTTIALSTAISFAQKGFKTLVIDADLNAPTFDSIFAGLKPKYRFNDYFEYELQKNKEKNVLDENQKPELKDLIINSYIEKNLDLIFANPKPKFGEGLLSMDKNFHAEVLKKLIKSKMDFEHLGYDYVVMDTSPALNLSSINAIIIADASVIVLRPINYGIAGTTFLLKELYSMLGNLNRKDYIVFNQVVPKTPNKLIEQWEKHFKKRLNIDTIGIIYCSCEIALNMLFGKIITEYSNDDFLKTISKIVDKILSDLPV